MPRRSPLYVAMHEAGHTVAMLANTPSPHIRYVSVGSGERRLEGLTAANPRFQPTLYEGAVEMNDEVRIRLRRHAWLDIVDALAGPIAEYRFKGSSKVGRSIDGYMIAKAIADPRVALEHGNDQDLARRRLLWLEPKRIEELCAKAWAQAEDLIGAHWSQVDELGRWLNAATRIEGDEIRQWWERSAI